MRGRGFTLLEMLLVTLIVALISALGFEALGFGSRVWSRATEWRRDAESLGTVRRVLTDNLHRAYPAHGGEGTPFADPRHVWFSGSATEARWITAPPTDRETRPWRELRLFATVESGTRVLKMAARDLPTLNVPEQGPTDWVEEIVLRDVGALELAYYRSEDIIASTGTWLARWEGETVLPTAVRVRVFGNPKPDRMSRTSSASRPLLELVARPWVDDDAVCEFDVVSRRCR